MDELVVKTEKEIFECINLQKEICKEKGYPHFAPKGGICYKCGRNIYQNYNIGERISNGGGEKFITGCPHCHRSYCD